MPKIIYSLEDGIGLWTNVSDTDDALVLSFRPAINGYIQIEKTVYHVKSGEVTIGLSEVPDGDYRLRLEAEDGGFILEAFEKYGKHIKMKSTEDAVLRRLLTVTRDNKRKLDLLEKKVSVLIDKTEGHRIFN